MVCEPSPPMVMMASIPSLRPFSIMSDEMSFTTSCAVFDGLVAKRIAPVGGTQNGAAPGQNSADVFESKLARLFRPDQAIKTILNTYDLPFVFQDGAFDGSANDSIEAGCIPASSGDSDASNFRHKWRARKIAMGSQSMSWSQKRFLRLQ